MNNPYLSTVRRLKPAFPALGSFSRGSGGLQLPMVTKPPHFVKPPLGSLQIWDARGHYVQRYAWAVPTAEAIRAIAEYSPIVEIGAGSGYWAWMLRQAGASVLPYDVVPPPGYWRPVKYWTRIRKTPNGPDAARRHPDKAMLLCWPSRESWPYHTLQAYKGDVVIYVGEPNGCTADPNFHFLLNTAFELERQVEIPQWECLNDSVMIYRRLKSPRSKDRTHA